MDHAYLKKLGFEQKFEQEAELYDGLLPVRVSEQHRELYKVIGPKGEMQAVVSGKLAFRSSDNLDYPAVGDWVMVDREDDHGGNAIIHAVLSRKSVFERKAAGTSNTAQIVAANIDIVFICMSLNADFNIRRLERYLAIAWSSRAKPVIVLTKSDLSRDVSGYLSEIATVSGGADVLVSSSMQEDGLADVSNYIREGCTIAFIGSSGVGKSSMINRLAGREILETKEIREDDAKGRHATTHRQLIVLPGGGIVIDTPGMRELQLDACDLSRTFEEIETIAEGCRYRDCTHTSEPGCAVRKAIEKGSLSQERLNSYLKLQKEAGYEGLDSRRLEEEKIKRMFGSKGEMKQAMRFAKNKNKR